MKTLVVYHKNCMDGLGAAASYSTLVKANLKEDMVFKAIQHGEPAKENFMKNLTEDEKNCSELVFLDFSLDKEQILETCNYFEKVLVIDHHKTAEADLQDLDNIKNLELIFDMTKSGAMLTWEYVYSKYPKIGEIIPIEFIQYIQDRDLWYWDMFESKAFSEGLRLAVDRQKNKLYKQNISLTDEEIELNAFLVICTYLEIGEITEIGKILLEKTESMVNSKIKMDKLKSVWFGDLNTGVEVLMLNATENISEIGNAICLKYNVPAMMYFILETGEVVFSLRSTDDLPDVSKIAKAYGGGGHRNACGFKGDLNLLGMFLSGNPEAEEL